MRTFSLRLSRSLSRGIFVLFVTAMFLFCAMDVLAQGRFRERLQSRFAQKQGTSGSTSGSNSNNGNISESLGGLKCAIWLPPASEKPAPLVVFSHGFHGSNTQSSPLMKALAAAGYFVIAPNHHDAMGGGSAFKPEVSFKAADQWTDDTYSDRKKDFADLLMAVRNDPKWSNKIDWKKVAYVGHSLGGYTVLGLAGAWPSWRRMDVKAVIALSPYCQPYVLNGNLGGVGVPVMYQGGTRDFGCTPFVKRPGGAFSKTNSPAYFVEFDKAGHLAWTGLSKDEETTEAINYYCISFLDKYLKGDPEAHPEKKLADVVQLDVK